MGSPSTNGAPRRGAKAPLPIGPLTGRRTPLRRTVSRLCAAVNRALDLLPLSRLLHARIRGALEMPELELEVPGAPQLDGLRLAFVSDVHAGSFLDGRDLCAIFERIAAAAPDLVLFGGDLINTRERELLLYRDALSLLRPRLGMYAVPGNHDHFWGSDIGLWTSFLQEHGVEVLLNRGVRVEHGGAALWVCGVDDLTEGAPDIARALAGRRDGEPSILLSHHPDFFFEAAAADVTLTLSGHTHGGQIRLFGKAPIHHSRFGYERGWFEENGCRLYVGRGVGVTVLPLRIDAPPEIPLVTLRCRAAAGDAAVAATRASEHAGASALAPAD